MTTSNPAPVIPNHHADQRGFSGIGGYVAGLTMTIGRGAVARFAADLAAVTAADRVVDVGCGPGTAAREAAARGAQVTGIDPAPVMLKLARRLTRRTTSIAWVDGVAEALPLLDDSASVLWSMAAVHHWRDVDAGLAEAHRVLLPHGRLLAIERHTRPGATGWASHGWTRAQADVFADPVPRRGIHRRSVRDPRADLAPTDPGAGGQHLTAAVSRRPSPCPTSRDGCRRRRRTGRQHRT